MDEKTILRKLEKDGEDKVKEIMKQTPSTTPIPTPTPTPEPIPTSQKLINLIKEGMKEYQEKTGKPMTYSEMREAYG